MGPALHGIFVGQGPRVLLGVRGKESPSHGFAVPAPFRQGGHGDGGTDCHSQCAHWLRNDTLQVVRWGGPMWASAPTEGLPIELRRGRCPHRPADLPEGNNFLGQPCRNRPAEFARCPRCPPGACQRRLLPLPVSVMLIFRCFLVQAVNFI